MYKSKWLAIYCSCLCLMFIQRTCWNWCHQPQGKGPWLKTYQACTSLTMSCASLRFPRCFFFSTIKHPSPTWQKCKRADEPKERFSILLFAPLPSCDAEQKQMYTSLLLMLRWSSISTRSHLSSHCQQKSHNGTSRVASLSCRSSSLLCQTQLYGCR